MLRFEGDRTFSHSPQQLWTRLADARFLARCIPDAQKITTKEPTQAKLTLRPGFAFVRGNMDLTLQVLDPVEPTSFRVLALGKGMGNSSEVEALLTFAPQEEGTAVHWTAEIKTLGGLLKMVPSGLIRGAAEKVLTDVWASVEKELKAEQDSCQDVGPTTT